MNEFLHGKGKVALHDTLVGKYTATTDWLVAGGGFLFDQPDYRAQLFWECLTGFKVLTPTLSEVSLGVSILRLATLYASDAIAKGRAAERTCG